MHMITYHVLYQHTFRSIDIDTLITPNPNCCNEDQYDHDSFVYDSFRYQFHSACTHNYMITYHVLYQQTFRSIYIGTLITTKPKWCNEDQDNHDLFIYDS